MKILVQMISQIVLSRLLFPSDFGLLAMAAPAIGFIQVFSDIGLGQAIIQRQKLMQDQVSALFWFNIVISILLFCLVVILSPLASALYNEPRVESLMIVLGALIPFSALGIHPVALLSRQLRFGIMARNEIAATFIGGSVAIVLAWKGLSYWSLIFGQAASLMVNNTLSWLTCGWRPSRPKLVQSAWADLKFGGNLTAANIATFLTTSGDNILIGTTLGRVPLGLYDRSYRLVVQPLAQMLAPINKVALTLLSRLNDKPIEYRAAYLKMFSTVLLVNIPIMLFCIVYSEDIILLFFGEKWREAVPVFRWICLGGITAGIYSSAFWLYISQDKTKEMARFMICASIINIASYLIGSMWGIIGVAALAALVFVIITTPLVLYGATRSGHVGSLDIVRQGTPFFIQAVLLYVFLILFRRIEPGQGNLMHVVQGVILSCGGFLLISLLNPATRKILNEYSLGVITILKTK